MRERKRKPTHPGKILDEHYIKPLNLNLQELADNIGISRNTLFKIRMGQLGITPGVAIRLATAFDTTPQLWLNLQQNYDLWVEEYEKPTRAVKSLYRTHPSRIRRKRMTPVIL